MSASRLCLRNIILHTFSLGSEKIDMASAPPIPSDLPVGAKRNDSTTITIQYHVKIHELNMSVSQIHI